MNAAKKEDDNSYRSFNGVDCEERNFSVLKSYNKYYLKIEDMELI
jgi:hypothetical protein